MQNNIKHKTVDKNISIGNYIYNELKTMIICLEMPPGEFISEKYISELFNSSRTPVKNAFTRLEIEQLITVKSQIGSYVAKIDKNMVIQLVTMRMLLEFSIVDEVCNNITEKDYSFLQENIEKQKQLISQNMEVLEKAEKFWLLDNEFHNFIFKIAKKEYLWKYVQNDSPHISRYRILSCTLTNDYLHKIIEDHEMILQNIYFYNPTFDFKNLYTKHILGEINSTLDTLSKENPNFFIH